MYEMGNDAIGTAIKRMDDDLAANVVFAMLKADTNTTHWYRVFSTCCLIMAERTAKKLEKDPKATKKELDSAQYTLETLEANHPFTMQKYDEIEQKKGTKK